MSLKYHVITGKKSLDQLTEDQPTLQGGTLTSYRKFRKNWLDNSIIGLKSEGASKSSNWPADVATDRGMIHAIDTVLVPGRVHGRALNARPSTKRPIGSRPQGRRAWSVLVRRDGAVVDVEDCLTAPTWRGERVRVGHRDAALVALSVSLRPGSRRARGTDSVVAAPPRDRWGVGHAPPPRTHLAASLGRPRLHAPRGTRDPETV